MWNNNYRHNNDLLVLYKVNMDIHWLFEYLFSLMVLSDLYNIIVSYSVMCDILLHILGSKRLISIQEAIITRNDICHYKYFMFDFMVNYIYHSYLSLLRCVYWIRPAKRKRTIIHFNIKRTICWCLAFMGLYINIVICIFLYNLWGVGWIIQ